MESNSTKAVQHQEIIQGFSADETRFTLEYRKIEKDTREKGIKFFVCIGEKPIT